MAKSIEKYFIALVPEGSFQEKVLAWRLELKERFNLKYALKTPAHITLKMPFDWNETKEEKLALRLGRFFSGFGPIHLAFRDFNRFGKRVIFIDVMPNPLLPAMQSELSKYCRIELKLPEELGDKSFRPHVTIAFKDTKPQKFEEYWAYIGPQKFKAHFHFQDVALLKRIEGKWEVVRRFPLARLDRDSQYQGVQPKAHPQKSSPPSEDQ